MGYRSSKGKITLQARDKINLITEKEPILFDKKSEDWIEIF